MPRMLKKELWPYQVKLTISSYGDDKISLIEHWLGSNIGCFHKEWNVVFYSNNVVYYFKDSRKAMMFGLRWADI
jgi:hypothetical protein